MAGLAAVKLGCLAALGLAGLLGGLLPAALRRLGRPGGSGGRLRSLVSGAAGGVFLGTCLLDILPDSLADLRDELRRRPPPGLQAAFPLAELVVALGFLLVLVTEQVVLECGRGQDAPRPEEEEEDEEDEDPEEESGAGRLRSLALAAALSVHGVFEGLAVGLQASPGRALELAGAIGLHKGLVGAGLGLQLLRSRLPPRWRAAALGAFAGAAPLGVGLGLAVGPDAAPASASPAGSLLQGLAAGTFLHVTFLEILPRQLGAPPPSRLPGLLALLLGFAATAALRLRD